MRCFLNKILRIAFLFPVFIFFTGTYNIIGQSTSDYSIFKPAQLKKLALKCELMGDYYTALEYMQECFKKDSTKAKSVFYLADLYRKSKQYDSALVYYSKPVLENDKKFPLRNFYIGNLLMIKQEYTEAKNTYNKFRRSYKGKESKIYRKLAREYMAGCDSALQNDTSKTTAYIYNLGKEVNSGHIEFSPYPISKDEIIYGTLPLDSANVFSRSKNNAPVRKLYIARKEGRIWSAKYELEWDINDPEFNTANAVFSPDGQRIYFTKCYQNWKYKTICNIYRMENTKAGWLEPVKLNEGINTEEYTSTQPAIGTNPKDGTDILYFVSDRPEGKGGMDIWYSTYDRRKQIFKSPKNLGGRVNTYADEITPSYNTSTQSLYFSSNGLSGYGGFDIYKIKGWGRKWEEVINVGTPVNSSYNDLYPALNTDGNSGFFTSNRPGGQKSVANTCCDDIYFFNWKLPRTIPVKGFVINTSNGQIVESINKKFNANIKTVPEGSPLDNVTVFLYREKNDGEKKLIQTIRTVNGKFNLNLERDNDYSITVKNYGYSDKTVHLTTKQYLSEDTIDIQQIGITYVPDIELSFQIYYEMGKSTLKPDDKLLLDTTVVFLMNLLPSAIIEIGAHTDNKGKEDFNLRLSQKRAEGVVGYLVEKGISEERLVAKGYGMSRPVAPNVNPDGTDNPEGRRKNRRTRVKIIGTLAPDEDFDE